MKKGDLGVDISTHNGNIDFKVLKRRVKFAIIRGGYSTAIDAKAERNIQGCIDNDIPFGVYWFSYALSPSDAKAEAEACIRLMGKYKKPFAIAFDYEYDSVNYAAKKGVTVTKALLCEIAEAFLGIIAERGYAPMLYTNKDFLNRGFDKISGKYKLWLASWTDSIKEQCDIWQFTDRLKLDGIEGYFDGNKYMVDETSENATAAPSFEEFLHGVYNEYLSVARDIIAGKYGTGSERKKKLAEAGYDYQTAQVMVTLMMK